MTRIAIVGIALGFAGTASAQTCWVDGAVSCDTIYSISNFDYFYGVPFITNDTVNYECLTNYPGGDLTAEFQPAAGTNVALYMTVPTSPPANRLNLDLMLEGDDCSSAGSGTCIDYSNNAGRIDERTDIPSADGGYYYISMDDKYTTYASTVELGIACNDNCSPGTDVGTELTCSSDISGTTSSGTIDRMDIYYCPNAAPYPFLQQNNPETVYSFSPQQTGNVTFRLSGMTVDQDIYVFDNACDTSACIAGSNVAATGTDAVTFNAVSGHTYYIVIEAFSGTSSYNLSFDAGSGGGCREDCDNGLDDDADGRIDCLDTLDCSGDPACNTCVDSDADGYTASSCGGTDCDDTRASVHPGATETCNSLDDNCVNGIDEGVQNTYYRDADADGYGTATTTTLSCSLPSGYVSNSTDCDDTRNTVHPGATEICNSRDDDCDSQVDESGASGAPTWYRDADVDGYGNPSSTLAACTQPSGYVAGSTDCNDASASVHPGATELCNTVDDDCDGTVDEGVTTTYYRDSDSDGYGNVASTSAACSLPSGYVSNSTDCNDTQAAIHPGATETCNNIDDNCDGTVDENASNANTYYADLDADTHGNASSTIAACTRPTGYVSSSDDCSDSDATIYPGATEICDGLDNDCDGTADEGAVGIGTWYLDSDVDGFGNAATSVQQCSRPNGYVNNSTDCNDSVAAIHPGADELCNTIDDDCDGAADESAVDADTFYADDDADGYGDVGAPAYGCTAPNGTVSDGTDCDDLDTNVNPGADELCNSIDDDCDGIVDDGALDGTFWYDDADGDTYGDAGTGVQTCSPGANQVDDATDCDDAAATVHPGALEVCDGVDQDCDGAIDDSASDSAMWFADADGDGFGDGGVSVEQCTPPSGYVADPGDCADADAQIYPGAIEIAYDGIDQDCDGLDLLDIDGDGYDGVGGGGTDCADADPDTNPGAVETADGVDEDCDGLVDDGTEWYDDDGDGFAEEGGDCDDADANTSPSAFEASPCDGVDNDCNGIVDDTTDCYDDDGDGLSELDGDCRDADENVSPDTDEVTDNGVDDDCDGRVDDGAYDPDADGYTGDGGDCDQTSDTVYPNAPETANGVDDDCDGLVDEGTDASDDDQDGWTELFGDCNDTDPLIHTDADEIPDNGVDDDCDGLIDEGGDYTDDDYDGFTEADGDCDDFDDTVYPGAEEAENGGDDDCDGEIDEDFDDVDGDGYSVAEGDCDDHNGWVRPSTPEFCDQIDNNCNADIDEGCEDEVVDTSTGKGCNCNSTGGASTGVFAILAGALLTIRRRARR